MTYRDRQRVSDILAAVQLATEPSIPWIQIARMRDHLAHRSFDTSHAILRLARFLADENQGDAEAE